MSALVACLITGIGMIAGVAIVGGGGVGVLVKGDREDKVELGVVSSDSDWEFSSVRSGIGAIRLCWARSSGTENRSKSVISSESAITARTSSRSVRTSPSTHIMM